MQDFERLLSEIDKRNELLKKDLLLIIQGQLHDVKLSFGYYTDIQRLLHEILAAVSKTDIELIRNSSVNHINAVNEYLENLSPTSKFSLDELLIYLMRNREN